MKTWLLGGVRGGGGGCSLLFLFIFILLRGLFRCSINLEKRRIILASDLSSKAETGRLVMSLILLPHMPALLMTSLASAKWQHSRLRFRDFQTSILTNRATNGVKDCCGSAVGRFDGRASDASAVLFLPCSVQLQRSEHSYTFSACWVSVWVLPQSVHQTLTRTISLRIFSVRMCFGMCLQRGNP